MAIQYMDGFQIYGLETSRIVEGTPWVGFTASSTSGLKIDPSGETTDIVLKIHGNGALDYRLILPVSRQGIGVAQRVFLGELPIDDDRRRVFCEIRNASNVLIYSWVVSPSGRIQLIQGQPPQFINRTVVAETVGPVMGAGVWTHLEVFNDVVTGEYELRIEGLAVLSGTDPLPVAIGDAAIISWSIAWQENFTNDVILKKVYIKDLIIWDKVGSSNIDFVGPMTVYTLPMNGDILSGWIGSDPLVDQYTLIDDLDPDDTQYISADQSLPLPAIFNFQNLPEDVVAVKALQTSVRRRKTDGGEGQMTVSLISGVSKDAGTNKTVPINFAYQWDISEIDPDTLASWTPARVDAAQIEIDRTI